MVKSGKFVVLAIVFFMSTTVTTFSIYDGTNNRLSVANQNSQTNILFPLPK